MKHLAMGVFAVVSLVGSTSERLQRELIYRDFSRVDVKIRVAIIKAR